MKHRSGKYIDAHLHLLDERFNHHQTEIIHLAETLGIERMICNSTKEREWLQVLELSQKHQQVWPNLGVHPWFADSVENGWLQRLEALLHHGAGLGEIGLDRLAGAETYLQEKVFIKQLELATQLGRPITIHCVKAWGRLLEILQRCKTGNCHFLFHSFAGSQEIMTRLLNMGGFFSFSAALADPAREKLRRVFMKVPLDRLLLETDAPGQYVPQLCEHENLYHKKYFNEPLYIPQIYAFAAHLREIDLHLLTTTLWKNGQIFTN